MLKKMMHKIKMYWHGPELPSTQLRSGLPAQRYSFKDITHPRKESFFERFKKKLKNLFKR